MGLHHHRKLSQQEFCHDDICSPLCSSEQDDDHCQKCITECLSNYRNNPPPPPTHTSHAKISTYLIITFAAVAAAFIVFCCYAIYTKFLSPRNRSTRRRNRASPSSQQPPQEDQEIRDEFLDEEHGPTAVDHHIWYIRTTGLHQSIINSITVCKYKSGEGLIEGTECSVCLSEFREDESLRLLPKCNHAFHLPCIDTWLGSHTNCPLCRAPIVANPARVPSMDPNVVDLGILEEEGSQIESSGMEESGHELRNGSEELEVEVEGGDGGGGGRIFQPRRSVSLDSSSAAKISAALATVVASGEESNGNSKRVVAAAAKGSSSSSSTSRTRNIESAPGSMKRSRSFNGKHLMSWYGGRQKKPNAPAVRSF